MAVRRQQYGRELEKQLAGGKSLEKAHVEASKKSMVIRPPKIKKKSDWVSRLKKNVKRYFKSLKRSEREKYRRKQYGRKR